MGCLFDDKNQEIEDILKDLKTIFSNGIELVQTDKNLEELSEILEPITSECNSLLENLMIKIQIVTNEFSKKITLLTRIMSNKSTGKRFSNYFFGKMYKTCLNFT